MRFFEGEFDESGPVFDVPFDPDDTFQSIRRVGVVARRLAVYAHNDRQQAQGEIALTPEDAAEEISLKRLVEEPEQTILTRVARLALSEFGHESDGHQIRKPGIVILTNTQSEQLRSHYWGETGDSVASKLGFAHIIKKYAKSINADHPTVEAKLGGIIVVGPRTTGDKSLVGLTLRGEGAKVLRAEHRGLLTTLNEESEAEPMKYVFKPRIGLAIAPSYDIAKAYSRSLKTQIAYAHARGELDSVTFGMAS